MIETGCHGILTAGTEPGVYPDNYTEHSKTIPCPESRQGMSYIEIPE